MNLSPHSRNKLLHSFALWSVDRDYAEPIYNYLVKGWSPGSFFTSVLANDFMSAVQHSHPANSIPALKKLVGWMCNNMPQESLGSYHAVEEWIKLTEDERRAILVERNLVYCKEDEVILVLRGDKTLEPIF